jgi:hypothetical protein
VAIPLAAFYSVLCLAHGACISFRFISSISARRFETLSRLQRFKLLALPRNWTKSTGSTDGCFKVGAPADTRKKTDWLDEISIVIVTHRIVLDEPQKVVDVWNPQTLEELKAALETHWIVSHQKRLISAAKISIRG